MNLFGFGKKKKAEAGCGCNATAQTQGCGCNTAPQEEEKVPCACGGMCTPSEIAASKAAAEALTAEGSVVLKVLGSGCKKCNDLEAAVKAACTELGKDYPIEHVTDFTQIATFGVMSTPALVINDKVVSVGKVLKPAEVVVLLQKVI